MLHIVNKSPFSSNNLKTCLSFVKDSDSVLLYEDAVLAVNPGSSCESLINDSKCKLYALGEDMKARGITNSISGVNVLDYSGFVDLVEKDKVHSWL